MCITKRFLTNSNNLPFYFNLSMAKDVYIDGNVVVEFEVLFRYHHTPYNTS